MAAERYRFGGGVQGVLKVTDLVHQTQLNAAKSGDDFPGGQVPDLGFLEFSGLGHHRYEIIVDLVDQSLEFLGFLVGGTAPKARHVFQAAALEDRKLNADLGQ